MKISKLSMTLLLALFAVSSWAQGPNNSGTYYQAANGLKGKALKTKLAGIIVNPRNVGYDGLYEGYKKTDTRSDGYVRDWYSSITNYRHGVDNKGSYSKEGDMYNREHSVPQSWFSGSGIKSDIVHVLPTDGYVNNRRSNYPFGEVGNVTYQSNNGYSKLGSCKTQGYSGTVFEPNDEIKGDIARIYFYMITRYESECGSWGHDVFTKTYPGLTSWTLDMMMRWSKQDPVDAREIARNNAVYEVQGNRNPYVDYPGLEEYTWGSKMDTAFSYDNYDGSGGDTPDPVDRVDDPVFSPEAGTYNTSVHVTLSCATAGASIYYTLDGTEPSISSMTYTAGGFDLTETTTVKAVAYLDGMYSMTTTATYTITNSQGEETLSEGTILLNNSLFGTSYNGSINSSETQDLTGTQEGVTVTYALGDGGTNRFCNNEQIRLYQNNKLTISASQNTLKKLEFVLAKETSKQLQASTGIVNNLVWTGNAQSVVFNVDDGSGNMQLKSVKVTLDIETGITTTTSTIKEPDVFTLSGVRVEGSKIKPGLYIVNGRKVIVK